MEKNIGESAGWSKEAKAYRASLKELAPAGEPMPSREDMDTFRGAAETVRTRRLAKEAGKSPEQLEAETAGKERLAEFVERGDLSEVMMQKLAVHLECEPWQALEIAEKNPAVLSGLIENYRANEGWYPTGLKQMSAEEKPAFVLRRRLLNVSDEGERMEAAAHVLRRGKPESKVAEVDLFQWREDRGRLELHGSPLREARFADRKEVQDILGKKQMSEGVLERFDGGYSLKNRVATHKSFWTLGRTLVRELPEEFGYKDEKEADLTMKKALEDLGRAFKVRMRFIGDGAYIDEKNPDEEPLRKLEVEQAKAIAEEYRAAKAESEALVTEAEAKLRAADEELKHEKRERELVRQERIAKERAIYTESMRGLLQEFKKADADIESPGTAVSAQHGFIARIIRTVNGADKRDREAAERRISGLLTKRQRLLTELNNLNRTVAKNAQPFAEYGDIKLNSSLEEWRHIAEEQDEIMVAEELAREELNKLKKDKKTPDKQTVRRQLREQEGDRH
jgi:hypothetical protein